MGDDTFSDVVEGHCESLETVDVFGQMFIGGCLEPFQC